MKKHAFLSASGAYAWTKCHAKVWREKGLPDRPSIDAMEGVAAHALLEYVLTHHNYGYPVDRTPETMNHPAASALRTTLNLVRELAETHGATRVLPEQKLDISWITGEEGATGTADVVIISKTHVIIVDLKYGMGDPIVAKDNEQLLIYGAAALKEYGTTDTTKLTMVVSQPRIRHTSSWEVGVNKVNTLIKRIRKHADKILTAKGGGQYLPATPGERQCKHCRVAATCQERTGLVVSTVTESNVDTNNKVMFLKQIKDAKLAVVHKDDATLATCLEAMDMIEDWCKAVREEVHARLAEGRFSDTRFKLVAGKEGNRKWDNEEEVLRVAQQNGIDPDSLTRLVTPTAAREVLDYDTFKVLEKHIVRAPAKLITVPHDDKRPALNGHPVFEAIQDDEYQDALLGLTVK